MWFAPGKPIQRSIDWVPLIGTSFERHPIEKERFRVRFGSGKRNVDGSAKRDDEATHANEAQAQDRPRMEGVAVHKRKAEEMDEDDYDEEDPAKEESDAQALKKKQKVEGEEADAGQVGEERKPAKAPMLVPKDAQDTDRTMEENHANETPKGHRTKKQTMTEFQERNKCVPGDFELGWRRISLHILTDIDNANVTQERSCVVHRRANEPIREFS